MKILWCITGAGDFLTDSIEVMGKIDTTIIVFLSRAGRKVLEKYKLLRDVRRTWEVVEDDDVSSERAGSVSLGEFKAVVVSPATANTVAKVANGIADNLVTTAVSMALKTGVPIYMVPTDWVPKEVKIPDILTPGGSIVHMRPRKADLRNIKYLESEGIAILESPQRLLRELEQAGFDVVDEGGSKEG